MKSRIVFFTLISTFLLLALVVAASATTRTVGVSVGNTFTYGFTVSWSSNDPNATIPSDLVDFNNTQWLDLSITAISGTNVTGQTTRHYKNGTETTMGGWVDVNTGNYVNISETVISANLAANDSMYTSSPYNTYIINETVPRTYDARVRDTNHLNTTSNTNSSSGTLNLRGNLYWDKTTGILVEDLVESTNQTSQYTTTASMDAKIISSDLWTIPEFPTWTSALLILIATTSATIIIARKRQPKGPPNGAN